jgi:hypothetical protein
MKALDAIAQLLQAFAPYVRVLYTFASETDAPTFGIATESVLSDGGQHLQIALRMRRPEVIYIRPDGYIGFRDQQLNGGKLFEYLSLV